MIRVFNRFELQTWMTRIIRSNTSRYIYFGIQSGVRQVLYAVSWVLEGLGIAAHQEVARYHVHRATGRDLDDFMKDIGLEVGKKGSSARGKMRIVASENAPESFSINASKLAIRVTVKTTSVAENVLTYTVSHEDDVFFSNVSGETAFAIVDYIADQIGDDYNVGVDGFLKAELASPHPFIEGIFLSGNGFTGGTETEYTDTEKQQQYSDYFNGLAKGVDSALRFAALSVPGVKHVDVGHADPTPGEFTVYIADSNGLTNNHVIDDVKTDCEDIRAAGVIGNYKPAKRFLLYIGGQFGSEAEKIIRDHINNQGFRPSIDVISATSDKAKNVKYNLLSPIGQIRGVYLVGASQNWSDGELRWNASSGSLSFSDGTPVKVINPPQEKSVYTLSGTEPDVYIMVKVDPTELLGYSQQETLKQYSYDKNLGYTFEHGDIARLAVDYGGLINA